MIWFKKIGLVYLSPVLKGSKVMYAIVDIAGKQYKVEDKQVLFVDKLAGQEGDKVEFDKVLLVENDGKFSFGAPLLKGAKISATIEGHVQGDKKIVFKKKRRKGYQKMNGHRQQMTQVSISKISA